MKAKGGSGGLHGEGVGEYIPSTKSCNVGNVM